ncbi:MAG: hypothetical protein KDD36_11660 [Flavobacteriales bacterium]|nr:hypothetical protein [Flavobacteriales bacterium]
MQPVINIQTDNRPAYQNETTETIPPIQLISAWLDESLSAMPHLPFRLSLWNDQGAHHSMNLSDINTKGPVVYSADINMPDDKTEWQLQIPLPATHSEIDMRANIIPISEPQCDLYFHKLEREFQLVTWIKIENKNRNIINIDEELKKMDDQFTGRKVPRPDLYKGYQLLPTEFCFRRFHAHDIITEHHYVAGNNRWMYHQVTR